MGRFAESDRDLHLNFMGHVRYDISLQKLEDIFREFNLHPVKKKTYCAFVGSLLMEVFYSFNEKLRYFTFPFLRLLLPLDKLTFGKPWQYYIVFEKGQGIHSEPAVNEVLGKRELLKMISGLEIKLMDYERRNRHLKSVLDNMQGVIPMIEKLLARVHSEADSTGMLIEAGEICFGFGNYDSARLFFEKAVSLDPENHEALNNLGVLELHKGNHEGARDLFIKALKAKPGYKEAKINLDLTSMSLTQKGYN
jgi:tetratricopeptide (TPR) repeat protein